MNTRMCTGTARVLTAFAVVASWALWASAAKAADQTKPETSQASESAKADKEGPPPSPAKRWVWLSKQSVWGYGYQREDGLWVIDPGTKRPAGDPYGFLGWLNTTRAGYGLPAVGYDSSLESWASANNAQQQARGMGHFVMGPARRQNAAMGSAASVGAQWMASPAHRAALLDPSIRWIGIAGMGAYWTFNAY